jgi:hypothetical protein
MNNFYRILFFFVCILYAGPGFSQEAGKLSGKVVDDSGTALSFATALIINS